MGNPFRTVIVSDLHLASPEDDRECASAFATFVRERRQNPPAPGMRWRLVVAGDLFDLEVRRGRRDGDWNPVREIDALVTDFPDVWSEMRQLAAAGHELVLVVGNHDAELALPLVAARVRRELGDGVTVCTSWHDVDRSLLVTHGHQLDPDNRFGVWPPRADSAEDASLGVLLTRYFVGPQRFKPTVHVEKPPLTNLLSVLRDYGLRAPMVIIGYFVAAFTIVFKHAGKPVRPPAEAEAPSEVERVLAELASPSTLDDRRAAFERLYLGRSIITVMTTLSVLLTLLLLRAWWAPWAVLVLVTVPAVAFAIGGNRYAGRAVQRLEQGARGLAARGLARTVVMGHIHRIAVEVLGTDGRYLNAGTFLTGPAGERTLHYIVEEGRGFRLVAAPVLRAQMGEPAAAVSGI